MAPSPSTWTQPDEIRKYLISKFSHVIFTEHDHRYYINDHRVPSVSTVIGRYKKPFKKDYWLKVKAAEEGITPQELEQRWDKKRDDACDLGHAWHDYVERRLLGKPVDTMIPLIERFLAQDNSTTVVTELVMGNPFLCGTMDNLILRNDQLIIRDWKTNGKFTFYSPYPLLSPLNHLPDTEYAKYCIQLNLYRRLLGSEVPVAGMELVWFDRESDTYYIIPVPFMDNECDGIIKELVHDHRKAHSRTASAHQ